jgi:hypothetical protein
MTMKKDGIQTRNRKLATKSKKRKPGSMHDFFKPFDARFPMYASNMAMATAPYLAASQYYSPNFAHFMPSAGAASQSSSAADPFSAAAMAAAGFVTSSSSSPGSSATAASLATATA